MAEILHYLITSLCPQYTEYKIDKFCKPGKYVEFHAFPPLALSEIFTDIEEKAAKENLPLHILHNPLDDSVTGMYLPSQQSGVWQADIFAPGTINFTTLYAPEHAENLQEIYRNAAAVYKTAKTYHDLEEEIYISEMNFDKANAVLNRFLAQLLEGRAKKEKSGFAFHRFFGAGSVHGNLCYIPQLTESVQKRYFIKGRAGTGKSTFLKKVARALLEFGFDTEIYHCSFDPNSLDMVIAREIGVCLFDSTAPHEFYPERETDEIIDFYQECVTPGTDEKYADRICELETAYKEKKHEGLTLLNELYQAQDSFFGALPPIKDKALQTLKQNVLQTIFE